MFYSGMSMWTKSKRTDAYKNNKINEYWFWFCNFEMLSIFQNTLKGSTIFMIKPLCIWENLKLMAKLHSYEKEERGERSEMAVMTMTPLVQELFFLTGLICHPHFWHFSPYYEITLTESDISRLKGSHRRWFRAAIYFLVGGFSFYIQAAKIWTYKTLF